MLQLHKLLWYYNTTSLCIANPDKTEVSAFDLKTNRVKRLLKVEWNRLELENTIYPKYLGVTLHEH